MKINVMDKIWDRKSFEVGGHWLLWRGWKNEWPRRTDNKAHSMATKISSLKRLKMQKLLQTSIWKSLKAMYHHFKEQYAKHIIILDLLKLETADSIPNMKHNFSIIKKISLKKSVLLELSNGQRLYSSP